MTALRFPWDDEQAEGTRAPVLLPAAHDAVTKRRGRRPRTETPACQDEDSQQGPCLQHLTVFGPGKEVDRFAEAARGSGRVPWRLDYAELEQDIFHLSLRQPAFRRTLSVSECRALARQFREQVEAHDARVAAAAETSGRCACPLDFHQLLPIPGRILSLGPRDPRSAEWLRTNWGMLAPPRKVVLRPGATAGKRLPASHRAVGYGFFSEGGTPHAACGALERLWPDLSFRLVAPEG